MYYSIVEYTCIYSKNLNTIYLPKRNRQTVQTQIRLLQKKQSDQGIPCLLLVFRKAFCDFQPWCNICEKSLNFRAFTVNMNLPCCSRL